MYFGKIAVHVFWQNCRYANISQLFQRGLFLLICWSYRAGQRQRSAGRCTGWFEIQYFFAFNISARTDISSDIGVISTRLSFSIRNAMDPTSELWRMTMSSLIIYLGLQNLDCLSYIHHMTERELNGVFEIREGLVAASMRG